MLQLSLGSARLGIKMIVSSINERVPMLFPAIPGESSYHQARQARDYSPEQPIIPDERERYAPQYDVYCDRGKPNPKRPHD